MTAPIPRPFELPDDASDTVWIAELGRNLLKVTARYGLHPKTPDEQRRKANDLAKMMIVFLSKHPALKMTESDQSLGLLAMALDGLDQGRTEPMLQQRKRNPSSKQISPHKNEFVSFVLVAHRLCVLAGLGASQSDAWFASALGRAGFQPGQKMTTRSDERRWSANTISGWRDSYPAAGLERDLFELRLSRFRAGLDDRFASGATQEEVLRWIDETIIKAEHLRSLRL